MRKRSKYRPRNVYVNPVAFVIEKITPVRKHESYLVDLKIKNHGAMTAVMRGSGTFDDINTLMAMSNMCEALVRLGFGKQYAEVQKAGARVLRDVAQRLHDTGRATLYAHEIETLNDYLDLHDAQMEVITVQDIERGLAEIKKDFALGRATLVRPRELAA